MKKYTFIPALSAGYLYDGIRNDKVFKNGMSMDYYNYDSEFRHPYFLITAGHHYKKDHFEGSKFFKKPDNVIFGDSGGFQIATGAIKWDLSIRNKMFTWLENNSTIAANLDIPVASKIFTYQQCLDISKDNFKYFHDNQSGKTKYLNVLQGYSRESYSNWYNEINEYTDFHGWCVGNSGSSISNMIDSLFVLLFNKEHLRSKVIHFLGCSNPAHMAIMSHMQNAFNSLGIDIQIYSDSSSPNASRFGVYYYGLNYKTLSWQSLHIPYLRTDTSDELDRLRKEIFERPTEESLPLTTPFAKEIFINLFDHEDLIKYNSRFCSALILNNTMTYKYFTDEINDFVKFPEYYRENIFNSDIAKLGTFVENLIKISDSKTELNNLYLDNVQLLNKFKNHTSSKLQSVSNVFFS